MNLVPGTVLAGYAIERLLGRGGMGEVYLAMHAGLGRKVALKLLSDEVASSPTFRDRFLAESRLAASLDHPHIVPIYEAGEADGRLFIAMRYVEGVDLGTLIKRGRRLTPERVVGLLRGIAEALDAAHERGLVHRDVKPENILVAGPASGREHAYLADFGLTKQLGADAALTRSNQMLGSVGYMAPEQIEGRPVDGRADGYSLACVLYESLTGRPPFGGGMASLWAHVNQPRPRPSEIAPELAPFDDVIAKGMAVDPAERYATIRELIAAAEATSTGPGERVPPPTVHAGRNDPSDLDRAIRKARSGGARRMLTLMAAVAIVLLVGGIALSGSSPRTFPSDSPSAAASLSGAGASIGPSGPLEPAGTRIVFSRQAALYADPNLGHCGGITDAKLQIVNPDDPSVEPYRLTVATNLREANPWWSADGRRITFAGTEQGRNVANLFATNPAGAPPESLMEGDPGGAYDGARLMPGPTRLESILASGGRLWRLPDGTQDAIVIYGRDPATKSPAPIVVDAGWLPNGEILAVVGRAGPEEGMLVDFELRQLASDGTHVRTIPISFGDSEIVSMVVSPDGEKIAVELRGQDGADLVVGDLATGIVKAAVPRNFAGGSPTWSPDATRIAYQRVTDEREQIWTVEVATGARAQVTSLRDYVACSPSWGWAGTELRPPPTTGYEPPFETGILARGRYRISTFHPVIELAMPAGWFARRNYADGIALRRVADPIVEELDVLRIQVGQGGPCMDAEPVLIGPAPRDLLTWFRSRNDLMVSEPSPVNLGGYPGLTFEVSVKQSGLCDLGEEHLGAVLYRLGDDVYVVEQGEAVRLTAIDVEGVTVTIHASSTTADLPALLGLAQPILDSMTFPRG